MNHVCHGHCISPKVSLKPLSKAMLDLKFNAWFYFLHVN
nr:MAG TPA: hypothetical protein [Caudoviricetes sp.]